MTTLVQLVNDVIPTSLMDKNAPPKEVNDDMGFPFIQVNDDVDDAEEDKGDEERNQDDENETDKEQGDLHLYDDDNDDNDENDDEIGDGEDDADN